MLHFLLLIIVGRQSATPAPLLRRIEGVQLHDGPQEEPVDSRVWRKWQRQGLFSDLVRSASIFAAALSLNPQALFSDFLCEIAISK